MKYYISRDIYRIGTLDAKEVANVCRELGTSLGGEELLCAINLLDTHNEGVVSFDVFKEWYSAHK